MGPELRGRFNVASILDTHTVGTEAARWRFTRIPGICGDRARSTSDNDLRCAEKTSRKLQWRRSRGSVNKKKEEHGVLSAKGKSPRLSSNIACILAELCLNKLSRTFKRDDALSQSRVETVSFPTGSNFSAISGRNWLRFFRLGSDGNNIPTTLKGKRRVCERLRKKLV